MQAWMEGYESDIEYTSGYYREQEPDFLNLCAVSHGVAPIDLESGFTYCELGCGQGLTSLIMAANYPQGMFYAIDFNPSHIARARSLAAQAGLDNIVFLEKSFAQLIEDPGLLPECDFIALHGIFTWVSDENRQYIIDICKRHLKSGGVVYNSYNAKPGWSLGEPIQKMMISAGKLFTGDSLSRFDQATKMLDNFAEVGSRYFAINKPMIDARLEMLKSKDKHYLVHEYFNEGWRAFYFTEIAEYLAAAKLDFIGEATTMAAYVEPLLPKNAGQFLASIKDRNVRELFKDVMLNTVFRKDIYRRGIIGRLDADGQRSFMKKTRWMLRKVLDEKAQTEFKFKMPLGEVNGKSEVYKPILNCLATQTMGFEELQENTGLPIKDLMQALLFLNQENIIAIQHTVEILPSAIRLNRVLLDQIFTVHKVGYVALPAVHGSINLSLMDILFYRAVIAVGVANSPDALVMHVAGELQSRGLKVNHDGRELAGQAMLGRLVELEGEWRNKVLPILRNGGAIE